MKYTWILIIGLFISGGAVAHAQDGRSISERGTTNGLNQPEPPVYEDARGSLRVSNFHAGPVLEGGQRLLYRTDQPGRMIEPVGGVGRLYGQGDLKVYVSKVNMFLENDSNVGRVLQSHELPHTALSATRVSANISNRVRDSDIVMVGPAFSPGDGSFYREFHNPSYESPERLLTEPKQSIVTSQGLRTNSIYGVLQALTYGVIPTSTVNMDGLIGYFGDTESGDDNNPLFFPQRHK
ncbi:MAG: hypothetical protein MN733_18675 [Nitrososphaera sp.]|nr:hypothetical protein [Nitrososphaera sp.]